MGWLWASSSPPKSPVSAPNDQSSPAPSQTAPAEPVDPEIQKFFDLFKDDKSSSSKTTPAAGSNKSSDTGSASSKKDDASSSSWFSLKASKKAASQPLDAPPLDPLSESLLPTDMSCRQAFDLAWGCNGLGGQWNAVYRNGTMRSCSEHWDDFWFCMRTKNYSGEGRENMIRAHYRNKEHAKYGPGKPSSEDVWEGRGERVPYGSAFNMPVEPSPLDDNEWREERNEERRQIRQRLGFNEASSQ